MYIKNVKIKNFRALRSASISLRPGLNILIGPNNVGKTTILSAIDFVLNPNIQWWRREALTELDFFRGKTDEPIEIELSIGCGRWRCLDGDDQCPRLEVVTEDKSEPCRLADRTVTWDNKKGQFLGVDEVEGAEEPESAIRIKMTSAFQKAEGYVETTHVILNEGGDAWTGLTVPMKEWIGGRLLASNRDPMAECKMQYNSLLSRAVGDIKTWRIRCAKEFRQALSPIVKELASIRATGIVSLIDQTTKDIGRTHTEQTVLSLGDVRDHDIIRQIELCRKGSEDGDGGWEIPFSRQGRGLQNVASLVLGIHSQSAAVSTANVSIIMLEEPEQNLEPQMQRSSVKSVMALSGGSTQVVMTTHSPYVLSSIMDLKGVQRLAKSPDGQLTSFDLGTASTDGGDFFKLRKRIPHDMELLEALFSPLVVIWEGDSEAGFYPTLMRQLADYPSEWLAGVNAGDVGVEIPSSWFKGAGYEVIVVLDGDQASRLSDLATKGMAFLALPAGKKIEHLLADAFRGMEDGLAAQIILSGIGYAGKINWHNDFPSIWPALAEVFREKGLENKSLPLDEALVAIVSVAARIGKPQSPENVQRVLENNKRRRIFEAIAVQLHKNNAIPPICVEVLDALKEIWLNNRPLGQYQFDASGNLTNYNP